MSITNTAFLLSIVATFMDRAYSMHSACTFCSCTQLSGLVHVYELVKIGDMF